MLQMEYIYIYIYMIYPNLWDKKLTHPAIGNGSVQGLLTIKKNNNNNNKKKDSQRLLLQRISC